MNRVNFARNLLPTNQISAFSTAIMDRTAYKMQQFDWLIKNFVENFLKILDCFVIFLYYFETIKSDVIFPKIQNCIFKGKFSVIEYHWDLLTFYRNNWRKTSFNMTEKEQGDNAPDKKGNLHRINLSSLRPQWRLYSFSLVDIFVTWSALTS